MLHILNAGVGNAAGGCLPGVDSEIVGDNGVGIEFRSAAVTAPQLPAHKVITAAKRGVVGHLVANRAVILYHGIVIMIIVKSYARLVAELHHVGICRTCQTQPNMMNIFTVISACTQLAAQDGDGLTCRFYSQAGNIRGMSFALNPP